MSDLDRLLGALEPALHPGIFVFTQLPDGAAIGPEVIVASVREPEGLSVVLREDDVHRLGLPVLFRAAWITLSVPSALDAVGLTAAVATALAREGISCNVVAGACHDHLFVPIERSEDALAALQSLQRGGR